ncbi:MAG: D-aminoacyl-tRNA deacylase [Eubacteriales bacterium]|nr:D-aminoacyl-tRNA deacylase [Eubacteriales bacterium]
MRALIQVVRKSAVSVDGQVIGSINRGFTVFLGYGHTDTPATCEKLLNKMLKLRIFPDATGKTNCSLQDIGGELLMISQFTLYADCKKGNRPSFIHSAPPEPAKKLYAHSIDFVRAAGFTVATGEFGADMTVDIENDGPFTIWLDSDSL